MITLSVLITTILTALINFIIAYKISIIECSILLILCSIHIRSEVIKEISKIKSPRK